MTDLEYQQMLEEIYAIPIEEVGSLVMEDYGLHKGNLTAKCPDHEDKKLGNVSFKKDGNYVKCFSCLKSWNTLNLVKDCEKKGFKDAIFFLYQHFPSYFSKAPDFTGSNEGTYTKWEGLSNNEYAFLKISTRLRINGQVTPIKIFAETYPNEHDNILFLAIKNKIKELNEIKESFLSSNIDVAKIEKDYNTMYTKIINYLKKGLMNKEKFSECKQKLL